MRAADFSPEPPHGLSLSKEERHNVFGRWILSHLLSADVEGAGGRVLDVAGGKGHLSAALSELGVPCTLIDPFAGSGRHALAQVDDSGSDLCSPCGDEQPVPPYHILRQRLKDAVDAAPELVKGSGRCSAIVGLHPDEATEEIVDTALALQLPFAVVPCCVVPQLFPERRHPRSSMAVRKYGAFIEYLLGKDARIKKATLPFGGRNTVVYMAPVDYIRAPRRSRQERRACVAALVKAAEAGDLDLVKELRAREFPWSNDVSRGAALGGHLEMLKWMRAEGCPWSESTVWAAKFGGHTALLEWAVLEGCPSGMPDADVHSPFPQKEEHISSCGASARTSQSQFVIHIGEGPCAEALGFARQINGVYKVESKGSQLRVTARGVHAATVEALLKGLVNHDEHNFHAGAPHCRWGGWERPAP